VCRPISAPKYDEEDKDIIYPNNRDYVDDLEYPNEYFELSDDDHISPELLSNELCEFLDISLESMVAHRCYAMVPHSDVIKKLHAYFKDHGLMNGQNIKADKRLFKLFPSLKEKNDLSIQTLDSYLAPHFPKSYDVNLETNSKWRINYRNSKMKKEFMEFFWHTDRIQQIITRNPGLHWNHEEQAYTCLDFNSMADIL
jgi:hypothetical protein